MGLGAWGTHWRCVGCCRSKNKTHSGVDRVPCGDVSNRLLVSVGANNLGHSMWITQTVVDHTFFVFCSHCGSYAQEHPVSLLSKCPGKPSSKGAAQCKSLILRGKHPKHPGILLRKPWRYLGPLGDVEEAKEPSGASGVGEPLEVPAVGASGRDPGVPSPEGEVGTPTVACVEALGGPGGDEEDSEEDVFGWGPCGI